jgi:hypothetical protein
MIVKFLKEMEVKITLFWGLTPCSLVEKYVEEGLEYEGGISSETP